MSLKKAERIYFMGIGGTGMASVAGLAQEAGYLVSGSDTNIYPPMSTMLAELGIEVLTPYSKENIQQSNPDLVVVANALSRGHIELEELLARDIPYTSFPAFLGDHFLNSRASVVVAGTHGKTTTTSLLACVLTKLGLEPGYLIGGIPRDLPQSFALGKGPLFAIEGDEYDTAFFDKNSKFLHYRPKYLILNNLEFDHADIFPNLEAIEHQFTMLLKLVEQPKHIIANIDDPGVAKLLDRLALTSKVTTVAAQGVRKDANFKLVSLTAPQSKSEEFWQISMEGLDGKIRQIETQLAGPHNAANICQVVACLELIQAAGDAQRIEPSKISEAIRSFSGVKRRLDRLSSHSDIDIFEDFAHHPTAVKTVIESLRTLFPKRRLLVAFEPKNATSRRNIFMMEFANAFGLADRVFIGACPVDQRIPVDQRMDTEDMAKMIGTKAEAFVDNEALLASLYRQTQPNDTVIFMSSGSFSGIQYKLGTLLKDRR